MRTEFVTQGPTLPTWGLQRVVSYLGYTGRDIKVVATTAAAIGDHYSWFRLLALRASQWSSARSVRRSEPSAYLIGLYVFAGAQQMALWWPTRFGEICKGTRE